LRADERVREQEGESEREHAQRPEKNESPGLSSAEASERLQATLVQAKGRKGVLSQLCIFGPSQEMRLESLDLNCLSDLLSANPPP